MLRAPGYSDGMKSTGAAPWVRLGFLAILALILGVNPSMPLPLKLVALSLVVLNLVLTLLKWRAARQRRSLPEDGDPS